MANSFSRKQIRVELDLYKGEQKRHLVYEGLETHVAVEKPGEPDQNKCTVEIYNMSMDAMRDMTTLAFRPLQSKNNTIAVYAGDEINGMSQCFAGEVQTAYADFSGAPTIKMHIEAAAGAYAALKASGPIAVNGTENAADLIQQFAKEAGYSFRNNGVSAQVKNAVLNGSPIQKARSVAGMVGCELIIDDNTVIIQPFDKGLDAGNATLMSKDSGMLGYPTFTSDGISLKCLYNPDLQLGGMVEVKSVVPGAEGTWKITKLSHSLVANANSPGDWFSAVEASPLDAPPKEKKTAKEKKSKDETNAETEEIADA